MEHKSGSLSFSWESAFTNPISVTKPVVLAGGGVLSSPKGSPSSITPPIEISSSWLTKLTRRTTDRKSEFLKTLKDDQNGDFAENRDCDKLEDLEDNSTPEPKENGEEGCLQNGLSLPVVEERGSCHTLWKQSTEEELRVPHGDRAAQKKWLWKEQLLAEPQFQPVLPLEKHL
ncbi:Vasculin-like protein 1 [Sciurus carolinensis]|uniref:Vasculin-like protein 1 n=1 Tax=Sciurus carolinensis TaxID=30640 RepID=A0AA41N9D6_SCICA|nr:Vasculin-like protein 1 [Sciurus carolinensis]